jgi:hypothetical protein
MQFIRKNPDVSYRKVKIAFIRWRRTNRYSRFGITKYRNHYKLARLMLDGFGATFRFEWATALVPREPWIPKQEEYIKAIKDGFKETYGRLVQALHTFD